MANTTTTSPGGEAPRRLPFPKAPRGIKGFFNEVGREMRKVNWPTKAETNRLTGVVIALCVAVVVILSAMSYVFDTLIHMLTKGNS